MIAIEAAWEAFNSTRTKECKHCGVRKRAADYCRDLRNPNGLQSWCRECMRKAYLRRKLAREGPKVDKGLITDDRRPHVYAAKIAGALRGKKLSPSWVRRLCYMARARSTAEREQTRAA